MGMCCEKEDNDWMKECMQYEVEGARPKGRPEKTWRLWKKIVGAWIEQGGCHGS